VIIRHAAVHHGILLPLGGALGERQLGGDDFLEQRIFRRLLLDDPIVDIEPPAG
jgi:hypothetical protein